MELNKNVDEVVRLVPDKSILPELFGRRIGYSKPVYPGFYHVHRMKDYAVEYMDTATCKEFNATLEEIKSLGSSFQSFVTHPEDLTRVKDLLEGLRNRRTEEEILTYFQRIKLRAVEKEGYTLVITSVKLNLQNQTFCCISNTTDQLPVFTKKICNALNSQHEIRSMVNAFVKLTEREKQVFKLLVKNQKTREIARTLSRSVRTIEQHKKNIYKKFNVHNIAQLLNVTYQLNL